MTLLWLYVWDHCLVETSIFSPVSISWSMRLKSPLTWLCISLCPCFVHCSIMTQCHLQRRSTTSLLCTLFPNLLSLNITSSIIVRELLLLVHLDRILCFRCASLHLFQQRHLKLGVGMEMIAMLIVLCVTDVPAVLRSPCGSFRLTVGFSLTFLIISLWNLGKIGKINCVSMNFPAAYILLN